MRPNTRTNSIGSRISRFSCSIRLSELSKADNKFVEDHKVFLDELSKHFPFMKQRVEELGLTDQIHKKPVEIVSPHIVESLGEDINKQLNLINDKKRLLWGNLGFTNDLFEGITNQENQMINPEALGNAYSNKDVGRRPDLETLLDSRQLEGIQRQRHEQHEQRQKKDEEALNMMISQRSNRGKEMLKNPEGDRVRNQSTMDIKNSAMIAKDGLAGGSALQGIGMTTSQGSNYQGVKQPTPGQSQVATKPVVTANLVTDIPKIQNISGVGQYQEKDIYSKQPAVQPKPASPLPKISENKLPSDSAWASMGPAQGAGIKTPVDPEESQGAVSYGDDNEGYGDWDPEPPKPNTKPSGYSPSPGINTKPSVIPQKQPAYGAKSTPPVQQNPRTEFFEDDWGDL